MEDGSKTDRTKRPRGDLVLGVPYEAEKEGELRRLVVRRELEEEMKDPWGSEDELELAVEPRFCLYNT